MRSENVLVLLSGGVDSAACLSFYVNLSYATKALFVDFGQPSRINELKAAQKISAYYDVPFHTITVKGYKSISKGFIKGRNLFLLSAALMAHSEKTGLISLGIHAGTSYSDCTPNFMDKAQSVLDIYEGGKVLFAAPFAKWSKNDIWEYCKNMEVPVKYTYSCELGLKQPCGKCLSCRDLKKLYAG